MCMDPNKKLSNQRIFYSGISSKFHASTVGDKTRSTLSDLATLKSRQLAQTLKHPNFHIIKAANCLRCTDFLS